MDSATIEQIIAAQEQTEPFSGVLLVRRKNETLYARGHGLAYRAESIPNTINTRFATASGTKTFTAVAVCQLIEQGRLALDTPLTACTDADLPPYDPGVTMHHLLSHTAGIPDYLDEETMTDEDYTALYAEYPVYTMRGPADYLRMFPHGEMHFKPGERFRYCNGGYILLALIVEQLSNMPYQQYVEQNVFARAGMADSGFFEMDRLPERTAFGYVRDADTWRTNIFSLPIVGGGDGGAYVTAPDMVKFWDALLSHKLLGAAMTGKMLTPQVAAGEPGENKHYGYGVWIGTDDHGDILRYAAVGGDIGVNFISTTFPRYEVHLTIIGNTEGPTWSVFDKILDVITA